MSFKLKSSNCSLIEDSSENSVIAKLRRLKIEENLLVTNINKINPKDSEDAHFDLPKIYSLKLKNYTAKLKNSLIEINNLFGDFKVMSTNEEKLNNVDIDTMKRDVVKLDDKIRLIKSYIYSELSSEMSREKELTKQMNEVEERHSKHTIKAKAKIMPFNTIVPSPVKVMIQSPFKCKEVQNFQKFMMSSPNRFGGWNEYHHNVFVHIWQKYFKLNQIILNEEELTVLNNDQFQIFQVEVLEKITGCTNDDIVSHHKWYCKYLYLKEQQQNALINWKRNKGILSKSQYKQDEVSVKPHKGNGAKVFTDMENVEGNSHKLQCAIIEACRVETVCFTKLLDTIETRDADEIANALCGMALQEGLSFDKTDKSVNYKALGDAVNKKKRSFNDVLKPTKQWISRCNSDREGGKEYNDLESIKKLRIPDWRLALQN